MRPSCPTPHPIALGCVLAAAMLAGSLFASPPALAGIDVQINIGNAPPAPRFVFRARPHERYYADEGVYVVDDPGFGDNDVFRYGGYYWVFDDGYWYRCTSWRGRFVVVHPRYVPAVFYRMPPARWKHHPNGPPMMNRGGGPPMRMEQGGRPPQRMQQDRRPPERMQQSGRPPERMEQGGRPPERMQQGNNPPAQRKQDGVAPGQRKQGGGPPGQARKGDKGGDHGKGKG